MYSFMYIYYYWKRGSDPPRSLALAGGDVKDQGSLLRGRLLLSSLLLHHIIITCYNH